MLSQELVAQLNTAIDAHADSISIRTDEQTLDGSDSIIHGNKAASGFVGTHGRGDFGGFLWDWGEPAGAMFRELIANENALRVLIGVRVSRPLTDAAAGADSVELGAQIVGDAFRLAGASGITQSKGAEGFIMHGGANPDNMFPTMRERDFHRWEATPSGGRMRNGLVRVGYQLTDAASEDDGGFCCIPSAPLFCSPHPFPD